MNVSPISTRRMLAVTILPAWLSIPMLHGQTIARFLDFADADSPGFIGTVAESDGLDHGVPQFPDDLDVLLHGTGSEESVFVPQNGYVVNRPVMVELSRWMDSIFRPLANHDVVLRYERVQPRALQFETDSTGKPSAGINPLITQKAPRVRTKVARASNPVMAPGGRGPKLSTDAPKSSSERRFSSISFQAPDLQNVSTAAIEVEFDAKPSDVAVLPKVVTAAVPFFRTEPRLAAASETGMTDTLLTASEEPLVVHVYNFDFSLNPAGEPQLDATILVGETVQWTWDEGVHSTTAATGQLEFWDSGVQLTGVFEHQFTQAGIFHYYSMPFGFDNLDGTAGGMSGTITVLIPEPAYLTFLLLLFTMPFHFARRRS